MKKLFATIALSLSLMLPNFSAMAQQIAVVNIGEVLQQLPQKDAIAKRLQDEFEVRIQELRQQEKDMQALMEKAQKDGALMSPSERQKLERKAERMDATYKIDRGNLEEDQRARGNQEQQKLLKKIQEAVVAVAKKQGYDLVLPHDATAYYKDQLDITDAVIKQVGKAK